MPHKLNDLELEKVILSMITFLQKKGALPPAMTLAAINDVVANVTQSVNENGIALSHSNLKELDTLRKLSTAIITAAYCPTEQLKYDNSGLNHTLNLIMRHDLTQKEHVQLTTALAFISVMQNKPELKLNLDLIFKENLTPEEELELEDSLAIALIALNEKILDPALRLPKATLDDIQILVKDELKKPAPTGPRPPAGAPENSSPSKADKAIWESLYGNGPLLGNIWSVPDDTSSTNLLTPIHLFSGRLLNPSQAASGIMILAEDNEISRGGIALVEAFENHFSNDDIPTYDSHRPQPPGGIPTS